MTQTDARSNVWLASYPKSGNTWMRIALTSLRNGGSAVDLNTLSNGIGSFLASRRRLDMALDVDSSDLSPDEVMRLRPKVYGWIERPPYQTTLWKVHDFWGYSPDGLPLFPAEVTAAALYLVRDPRDIAVSYSHHFHVSIDQAIEIMADPDYHVAIGTKSARHHLPQYYSSWSRHVLSWIDDSGLSPLLIRYEDMLIDLEGILEQVVGRLGWPCNRSALQGAVTATHFETLRNRERTHGFAERPSEQREFFRRGISGGWRDTLSTAQQSRIEKDHGPVMQRLGYL